MPRCQVCGRKIKEGNVGPTCLRKLIGKKPRGRRATSTTGWARGDTIAPTLNLFGGGFDTVDHRREPVAKERRSATPDIASRPAEHVKTLASEGYIALLNIESE